MSHPRPGQRAVLRRATKVDHIRPAPRARLRPQLQLTSRHAFVCTCSTKLVWIGKVAGSRESFGQSGTVKGCDGELVERVVHAARRHTRGALLEILIAVHPLRPGNLPATPAPQPSATSHDFSLALHLQARRVAHRSSVLISVLPPGVGRMRKTVKRFVASPAAPPPPADAPARTHHPALEVGWQQMMASDAAQACAKDLSKGTVSRVGLGRTVCLAHGDERDHLRVDACLLPHLTHRCLRRALTRFHHPAPHSIVKHHNQRQQEEGGRTLSDTSRSYWRRLSRRPGRWPPGPRGPAAAR